MDDLTVKLAGRFLLLSVFYSGKLRLIYVLFIVGCFVSFCFPDMVRKKKTENDWFKIENASYVSQGKQLRFLLKGSVKNSDLESVTVYEFEDGLPDRLILAKDKNISVGQLLARGESMPKESSDWIRKIGATRKWIRVELKNTAGMAAELQTEILVSETDKKVLRKDLSLEAEGDTIRLDGREWKVVSEVNHIDQALLQYVPKSESILFWTEMISIHVYKVKSSQPDQIYSLLETTKKKDCPSLVWKKEGEVDGKIAYFWEHTGCGKQSAMGEIAKLYKGEFGIYNIRYDRKGKISDADRTRWAALLDKLPGN